MSVWAIIPAAGTGARFGGAMPKPLAELGGAPVIARTLGVFQECPAVDGIVLVVHRDWQGDHEKIARGFTKVKAVVAGADTRTGSVRNALALLPPEARVVIVHDGVRPLVTPEIITAGLEAVKATGAAIAAVPVKPTIKAVDPAAMTVTETFDRSLLWEVQTPQVFSRPLLERAYREDTQGASDDAALVERMGAKVNVFMGAYTNIKITTPEDLLTARVFLK